MNQTNGDPKPISDEKDWGYSLGGPIGKPGGNNKLFFFYSHEYRPRNPPINNGNPIRLRVPTAGRAQRRLLAEPRQQRRARFAQLLEPDRPASTYPEQRDSVRASCTRPAWRSSTAIRCRTGRRRPARTTTTRSQPPQVENLTQQPAIRIDYQLSSKLRLNGKYSGQRARADHDAGPDPGLHATSTRRIPYITNYAVTVNYTLSPTTFVEGTYGFIRNELTGGNEGGVLVNDSSNRLNALPGFPLIYPNAGKVNNDGYYANEVLDDVNPAFWDRQNRMMNLPPIFAWGSRIGAAPPNQRYPGLAEHQPHAGRGGQHHQGHGPAHDEGRVLQQPQLQGAERRRRRRPQLPGHGRLRQRHQQPASTPASATPTRRPACSRQYQQASDFIEGQMVYNNTEFYVQDNWKVNSRMTLDYGMRFTHQQPQYDKNQQMSNFFPELWTAVAGADALRAGLQQRRGDLLGQHAQRDGSAHRPDPDRAGRGQHARRRSARRSRARATRSTASARPATASPRPATPGRRSSSVRASAWPTTSPATRRRSSAPAAVSSTTVRTATPSSRSRATRRSRTRADLRNGQLQTLGQGLSLLPVPQLVTFQYDAKVPASVAVAGGRAARAAVGDGHRPLVRRQPRLQPAGRAPGRHDAST